MVFAVNHISSPEDAESATTVRSPITVREEAPKTRSYVGADGNFLGVTLVSAYLPSDVRDGGDALANAADDGKEPG